MFRNWLLLVAATVALPVLAQESAPPSVEDVDQRLRILERKLELEKEAAAAKEKDAAKVSIGADGFTFKSADGSYVLKIRGYVHADLRVYGNDVKVATTDTFLMRRVRPIFEAQLGKLAEVRVMPDFGAGTTVLQDAYADVKFAPWLKLRAGKFKPPVGLERLQSATDLAFVERALPTNLVPNRDLGVQLFGDLWAGIVSYQAGVFDGVADGASGDIDINDSKELEGRIWISPFKTKPASVLKDLSFGVVATDGKNLGTLTATGLSPYRSAGQLTFFSYRSGRTLADTVIADGNRKRFGAQASFQNGRVAAQAEWVRSSVEVLRGETLARLQHSASQATVQILLTKDRAALKGFVPRRPFDPAARQLGALEVALRVGRLTIDDHAFPVFADPATSAKAAREKGVGLNWYLTRNLKISLDGIETRFDALTDQVERERERVLLSRVQIAF
ncbi:MAG: porin [Acidobacteriota bacterium]